jgi:hypothetical protein
VKHRLRQRTSPELGPLMSIGAREPLFSAFRSPDRFVMVVSLRLFEVFDRRVGEHPLRRRKTGFVFFVSGAQPASHAVKRRPQWNMPSQRLSVHR